MNHRLVLLSVLALAIGGCASVPRGDDRAVEPGTEVRALDAMAELFPSGAVLSHKVRVRVGRRDLVLTGHLLLDRDRGFRAVAVDEFGGKVFEFSHCDGDGEVVSAPSGIETDLVLRGPVTDLGNLYLATSMARRVVRGGDGVVAVIAATPRGELRCDFDEEYDLVRGCVETAGRRRIATYGFEGRSDGGGPATITLCNHRLHYRMRAELLTARGAADRDPCPGS